MEPLEANRPAYAITGHAQKNGVEPIVIGTHKKPPFRIFPITWGRKRLFLYFGGLQIQCGLVISGRLKQVKEISSIEIEFCE